MLEHLCEGGEDWDQGENPVPVPLPAGSAIKTSEGVAEAAARIVLENSAAVKVEKPVLY